MADHPARSRNPAGIAVQHDIEIDIPRQRMQFNTTSGVREYRVSTAANGAGEENGSFCTPRGRHVIRARVGDGCPVNSVFVGRRPTGEIYNPGMREAFPGRDWILTRILWLSGLEPGFNRLGKVDSMRRYIYIHGTPDDVDMDTPGSRGCVRMNNHDLIDLFDQVSTGATVMIHG